jgi:hypothetical protein
MPWSATADPASLGLMAAALVVALAAKLGRRQRLRR